MGMHEAMGASEDVTSSDNPHLCTKLEMGPMSVCACAKSIKSEIVNS